MLTQGISMWLTARAGGGGEGRREERGGSALLPRNGGKLQVGTALAGVSSHLQTKLPLLMVITIQSRPASPLVWFSSPGDPPLRSSDLSPVQMLTIFFSVNTIYPIPLPLPLSLLPLPPLLIHLSIYVHFHNPRDFSVSIRVFSWLYPLQRRLSFQFCSKFEGWVNNDHPPWPAIDRDVWNTMRNEIFRIPSSLNHIKRRIA